MAIPVHGEIREGCLACHALTSGFGRSHQPAKTGCAACHGGNPYTMKKDLAHEKMMNIPGQLDDAGNSCCSPNCHPGIDYRVSRSIMSTMSGVVTIDRFVFGEYDSLSALFHISGLGHTPADQHLRDLCANCHIGNRKPFSGPVDELSRGGGCNACHLEYDSLSLHSHLKYRQERTLNLSDTFYHPRFSLQVSDDHCFGCHSRSGRISTSYAGWHETQLDMASLPDTGRYRVLQDQRVFRFVRADVHHELGMQCTQCHKSLEVMGDGNLYAHKEQQVRVRCVQCHPAQTISSSCKDNPGHRSLTCEACHTAWAPQCLGCHNAWDPGVQGYDLLESMDKKGSWVEYTGIFLAGPPSLGVEDHPGGEKRVKTFVPGMILTIDTASFTPGHGESPPVFHRLFAPISAHTTSRTGRSCPSCHLDPLALGYGRGRLEYDLSSGNGRWRYVSRFAPNPNDNLPEDAWTGFLAERGDVAATREHMRPFNLEEQRRILTVGACLTCHEPGSRVMKAAFADFPSTLERVSGQCILPQWH